MELKRAAEPAFEAKNRPGVRQGQSRSAIGEPARGFIGDRETRPDGELPHEIDLTARESRCSTSFSTSIVTSLRPHFIGARTELRSRSSTDPVYVEAQIPIAVPRSSGSNRLDAGDLLLVRSRRSPSSDSTTPPTQRSLVAGRLSRRGKASNAAQKITRIIEDDRRMHGGGFWGRRRLVARGREVHVVLRRAAPRSAPAPSNRAEGAHDRGGHHSRSILQRLRYGMLARSRVRPQPVYGFSIGLMSTARPYACCDQFPVPLPHGDGTARRHSKPR